MHRPSSRRARLDRLVARAAFLLSCLFAGSQALAVQVAPLRTPQSTSGDVIEVLEFFAYGCNHCANLEPDIERWAKALPADVKFIRVPAPFDPRQIANPPIHYTLEAMKRLDLHNKIFLAANREGVILGNPKILNEWLAKQGIDVPTFDETQKSFAVQNKIARSIQLARDYGVNSTPTFAVAGRVLLKQGNGTPAQLFGAIDKLVAEERAARKAAKK